MGIVRLVFIALVIYVVFRLVRGVLKSAPARPGPAGPRPEPSASRSPYEILGVPANASQDEIRSAYQRLIQQYHPDRVEQMGPELRDLALRRTKEINAAYERLKREV
ncbi:MAG: J domain-containing protein [Deltaproteobacteria bacterium]|nr:J domain-containing protein [Deltaproteobacteria bacterium]